MVLVLLLLGVGCGSEQEERLVIRLGHALDTSHPVHRAMEHMAVRLAETSDSTMVLDIYPSEQLGTERQLLELLQIGSLHMTKVSSAVLEGFAPAYKLFGLPYVFVNDAHRYAVMEGPIGRRILLSSRAVGLRGLVFYDAGSRSFYTRHQPVRAPEDLQGLKIRTMNSPVAIRMINQMGGAATPIAFGELYTALQQGVVDGAENNPPSFHLTRHYELSGYYTLDQHTSPQDVLLVSTRFWERLTPEQRTWLQEAAEASARYQKELWEAASQEALDAVEAAGVEVIRPDKSRFVEAVAPLYAYYREAEPELYVLYKEVKQLGEQWNE